MHQLIGSETRPAQDTDGALGPKRYRTGVRGGQDLGVIPIVAVFEVDLTLAREIIQYALVVKANNADRIERFDYRASFLHSEFNRAEDDDGAPAIEEAIATTCDCLVVTQDGFFFSANVLDTTLTVESKKESIADLAQHFGLQFQADLSCAALIERLQQALPSDAGYEKGFKNALGSISLALAAHLPPQVLSDAITTVLDAYANNAV